MTEKKKSKILKKDALESNLSLDAQLDLKEVGSGSLSSKTILKKGDVESLNEAQTLLEQAAQEADAIKSKARDLLSKVEKKISEAKEKGYQDGREEGLASLTESFITLQNDHNEKLEKLESESVELVFQIAQKIIGEKFTESEEGILGMVQNGLRASMGDHISIFLCPEDYQKLEEHESELHKFLHGHQSIQLKRSEALEVGHCIIETEQGSVEADLKKQLAAIKKALGL